MEGCFFSGGGGNTENIKQNTDKNNKK